jgi:hypothetical protein
MFSSRQIDLQTSNYQLFPEVVVKPSKSPDRKQRSLSRRADKNSDKEGWSGNHQLNELDRTDRQYDVWASHRECWRDNDQLATSAIDHDDPIPRV